MTKKTLPLLSAAEARAYVPALDPTGVYAKIDHAVRNAVSLGRDHVDISTIVPQPNSGAWMTGKIAGNATVLGLIETLADAGYQVETFEGSPAKRGFINLSWAETAEA
ncbi:hypothetical protein PAPPERLAPAPP_00630 [Brevundimonas phage vB_BpoS-Papperlapapp]|uniref:Uncharacterized protein n=1 Tax=Brevundimonas phage vB_BpoS-Domovoi TaxID=2948598 RepID=A0A9E7MRW7_9CAUD|nr:hypothetical protein DOMOVOI_05400 [Brevundimonas phage vB_BpoS-Domovoi]USN15805.1 hypothetical protein PAPPERLAPAPP_00630 [Brevundimonas phage vB_BpoS-Papperlapapp]